MNKLFFKYPTIHMIEDVGTDELKRYHTSGRAPLHVILKEPHAWIAYNKPALPSQIVLKIPLHYTL